MINPAVIFGPYDTTGWALMIRAVYQDKLPGVPSGAVSVCHVREVVKAHIAAAERSRTGENYLLGGVDAAYLEIFQVIGEVTGRKVPSKPTPAWVLRLMGRIDPWLSSLTGKPPTLTPETVAMLTRKMFCDCSKAERELGYQPVPLRTIVEDSFRWLQQEGLL